MKAKTVQGSALKIGDLELTPLVQMTSYVKEGRSADGASGGGGGFVRLRPLSILEKGPMGARRIPVPDVAGAALRNMACTCLAAFLIWVGAEVISGLKGGRGNDVG